MICVSSFRITFSQPSMPRAPGQHPGEQSKALCAVLLIALGGQQNGGHWEADFTSAPADASSSVRLKGPYKKGVCTSQEATVYLYSLKCIRKECLPHRMAAVYLYSRKCMRQNISERQQRKSRASQTTSWINQKRR